MFCWQFRWYKVSCILCTLHCLVYNHAYSNYGSQNLKPLHVGVKVYELHTHIDCGVQNLSRCVTQTSVCQATPLTPQITLRSCVVSRSVVCGLQSFSVLLTHQELPTPRPHHVMSYIAVSLPQLISMTSIYWTVSWPSIWLPTTSPCIQVPAGNLSIRTMCSSGRHPLSALWTPLVSTILYWTRYVCCSTFTQHFAMSWSCLSISLHVHV